MSASENLSILGTGHVFCILLRNAFPVAVLNDIKQCQEVCRVFCATANPLQIVVVATEQGRGGVRESSTGHRPKELNNGQDKASPQRFPEKNRI